MRDPWPKSYITGSPSFLRWRLPLDLRMPRKVNGQGTTTRITLSASVLFRTFLLLRPEETPPLSAQGQGTLSQAAPARWLFSSSSSSSFSSSSSSSSSVSFTKPKREAESSCFNLSRVLFRHSNAGRGFDRSDTEEVISFNFMRIV